jgi:hypothetical protein
MELYYTPKANTQLLITVSNSITHARTLLVLNTTVKLHSEHNGCVLSLHVSELNSLVLLKTLSPLSPCYFHSNVFVYILVSKRVFIVAWKRLFSLLRYRGILVCNNMFMYSYLHENWTAVTGTLYDVCAFVHACLA